MKAEMNNAKQAEPPGPTGNAGVSPAQQDKCGRDARDPRDARAPKDAREPEWHSRGYLPHFDRANTLQGVTFRLHDSIPSDIIELWKQELGYRENGPADSPEAIKLRHRLEAYANAGHGACYLREPRIAEIVQNSLRYFDGERYLLYAWCIMPNHVHVLLETFSGYKLKDIVHSWKSFTAHRANKILQRKGDFWMPEYFDRRIRNSKHYAVALAYIHANPVKAGLVQAPEQWPWSSAGKTTGNAGVSPAPGTTGGVPATGNAGVSPAQQNECGRDARAPRLPRKGKLT